MYRRCRAFRSLVVAVSIVAWVSISNHCALGGLIATKAQSAVAPMHCHGNQPSPPNKSGEEEMPCCKMLRATVTSEAKIVQVASQDFVPIQSWIAADLIFANEIQLRCDSDELDTGPPFARSFAELILHRSVFAHAPPALA